jgi:AcrR family transcriptional regulator
MNKKISQSKPLKDHRVDVAEKKRAAMKSKLLAATIRVYNEGTPGITPVIEDIIREAKVSRGTFYNYFTSLEEVIQEIGQTLSDQMTTEILPVYNILKEPWQRFSVGYRLWLIRAKFDPAWAAFATKFDYAPHHTLVSELMAADIKSGVRAKQFACSNIDAATDFLLGATSGGVLAIGQGVKNPDSYINNLVKMALLSLSYDAKKCDKAVEFSHNYLDDWIKGKLNLDIPTWIKNL